jgi:hypothetical protein
MPKDHPDRSAPQTDPGPPPASPVREALLHRFRDPEDAAIVRRLGDLLFDVMKGSGQHSPEGEGTSLRSVLIAVAQNLLCDASNLVEIAAECGWN